MQKVNEARLRNWLRYALNVIYRHGLDYELDEEMAEWYVHNPWIRGIDDGE